MSVEQTNDFHVVRRILRTLAPEYRILARRDLEAGSSVLDVKRRTVEVGETPDVMQAVSSLLFQIGHLRLSQDAQYDLFFGKGLSRWKGPIDVLIDRLARLGARADRLASQWASSIFQSYWAIDPKISDDTMHQHTWRYGEWKEYFSSL